MEIQCTLYSKGEEPFCKLPAQAAFSFSGRPQSSRAEAETPRLLVCALSVPLYANDEKRNMKWQPGRLMINLHAEAG